MSEPQAVPLSAITIDERIQPRTGGLDADHVRALAETPDRWPALSVVQHGTALVLVDGFHRFAAARALNLDTVPVAMLPMPDGGDVRALAFHLNAAHGRPLTLPDRRAEARRLLEHRPATSNLEIARHAGLSPTTVASIRAELESADTIAAQPTRIRTSGHSYRPASGRPPGTLPATGVIETVRGAFTSGEKRRQRAIAGYLRRLAVALSEGPEWESQAEAAAACRAVLGDEKARALATAIGPEAAAVLAVAEALGFVES